MSNFYHCANCKDFFDSKKLLIEKGALHCPYCGGPVSPAQAHVDHRGQKIPERKIYKFSFSMEDEFKISMPEGSEVLTVQIQGGVPRIWAIVDTDVPLTARRFCMRRTGHAFKGNEGKYIGTFQLNEGTMVFHLFEERQK
jgi:DNA-directed RNA polymerase subunit RPC12/RpoP